MTYHRDPESLFERMLGGTLLVTFLLLGAILFYRYLTGL